jgi:hypothetical protein
MKYLVLCTCGHALDRHDQRGCAGEIRTPCACRRDARQALEAAVEQARVSPWSYQLAKEQHELEAG